jgi:Intracellular proteinase inhibitor
VGHSYNRLMRRPLALLVLLGAVAGCGSGGGNGSERQAGQQKAGLSLSVSFDGPLRAGRPVTWKLEVENGGSGEVTLLFRSGKDGDVSLAQGGREAYRWSAAKYFTQAIREERLAAGGRKTFTLEEKSLSAAAGEYELVAELDSQPAPPPARRSVKVEPSR